MNKTASFVFIHKSDKGALTLSFNDGNVQFTAFAEDITEGALGALKNRLDSEKKTSPKGKVYYQTKTKVLITFRVKSIETSDEFGGKAGIAYIEEIGDAPNQLEKLGLEF